MSEIRFDVGQSYVGTGVMDNTRKKVFQVVARRGRTVSMMAVRGIAREIANSCDGAEIMKIADTDGIEYFLSARVPVDIDEAHRVVEMCKG